MSFALREIPSCGVSVERRLGDPESFQADYYRRTASEYDAMHVAEDDEHGLALRYISEVLNLGSRGVRTVLDVGCGTGRAIQYLIEHHPDVRVLGVEPVGALLDVAVQRHGVRRERLLRARGEALPFPDQSFDAVCEFGVLHHVRRPETVVGEMLRVARKAVFISDSNRFGQGSTSTRWLKLLLYKCHLWWPAVLIKTRGRRYVLSDGDGLAYSYSVYDNYAQVARWARQVILVPTLPHAGGTWMTPLMTSEHVLMCAFR